MSLFVNLSTAQILIYLKYEEKKLVLILFLVFLFFITFLYLKDLRERRLVDEGDLLIEGIPIAVSRFVPRGNRDFIKNNLYLKNLPENLSADEISQKIEV